MIKALAAGEHEATRGVTAWYRLTRDHCGSSAQRILGLVGRVFQPQRCLRQQQQQKVAHRQRETSLREVKQEVSGVQELYPRVRVEEHDEHAR